MIVAHRVVDEAVKRPCRTVCGEGFELFERKEAVKVLLTP